MNRASWWQAVRQFLDPIAQRERPPDRRRRFRPRFEGLESRLAPAVTLSVSNPTPFLKPDSSQLMGLFVVTRSGDLTSTVQVNYATQDGTGANGAHAGTDYVATSGVLLLAANQATGTITVPVLGNNIFQADKTFTLSLSDPLPSAPFAPLATFGLNGLPRGAVVADFNGDGRPDLAFANFNESDTVSVLLNRTSSGATSPSFAPQQTFATGLGFPISVAVGDFNGDGKPDLVVSDNQWGAVSVLLNTTPAGAATPSFTPERQFIVGDTLPVGVAVGDFNGDGKPDIAVADSDFGTVSVLLNNTPPGATTPDFAHVQTFVAGGQPRWVGVGDFNGDGKPDLAVTNFDSNTVSVLLNTTAAGATAASFAAQQTFAVGSSPTGVTVADLNGDGRPDLAVADSGAASVSVLLNNTPAGAATPTFAPQQTFTTDNNPYSVVAQDVNGDGRPDLAVANAGTFPSRGHSVSVLLNTAAAGATSPRFAPQQTFTTGQTPVAVAVGDFNGDGQPDLAVTNQDTDNVSVLLNRRVPVVATASFAPQQNFATGDASVAVAVGDFNGDGKPDLVIANRFANTVSVLLNTTPAGATAPSFGPQQTFATGSGPVKVVVGDFNGDGKPDLAVVNFNLTGPDSVSVLLNTTPANATTPSFAAQQTFATGMFSTGLAVGDFNGDGRLDLAATNREGATGPGSVSVLLNTTPPGATTASFAAQRTFATGLSPDSVAVGDFNGDGKADLAIANAGGTSLSVLLNTTVTGATIPSFAPQQTFTTGLGPSSVAVGDFNGDGRPDLVAINFGDNTVSALLNTTPPGATTASFAPQVSFSAGISPAWVAVGDFNGDGHPDLAVANDFPNDAVSVLLNATPPGATTPSFGLPQSFATGSRSHAVAVGDFNGDGKPDLAVANYSRPSSTVSVLLNAPGTFTLSGSPATGTISSAPEAPTAVTAVAGTTPQSTAVNTPFPALLAVDVRDAAGHLVQGVSVTFTAPGSGASSKFGSASSVTVVTNASGRASAPTFVANTTAGSYLVTAQAAGGSNPSASFSLTNTPGSPAVLMAITGSNQSAVVNTPFPTNLLATLTDQFGNRVPGVTITFAAPGSGASASFSGGTAGTTDASGQVSKAITANTVAGTYTITAAASGGSNPTTSFVNLTNTPGVPAFLAATTGSNQSAVVNTPFATNLLATLTDQFGNRIPGVTITFTAPGSGASAVFPGGTAGTTDANGQVSKTIVANTVAGTYAITAVASGGSNPSTSFSLTNIPGAADHFLVTTTAAKPDVAGTPFDVTVTVQDRYGNTVTGYTGTVHFSSADPYGATLPADYTFQPTDQGTHTFPGGAALYTAGTWDVTATDTSSGITGAALANVVAAVPDHFAVTTDAADPDVAGTPFDVIVIVQDPYGNTVTGYTGTVTFSSADPYGAGLPADYTFQPQDKGMATFPSGAALYTAGTWDVTATDTSSGITGAAFVNVMAAPAVAFQVISASSATSGTPFDVTVVAVDPYGNTDTNYTGTITFSTSDPDPGVVLPADYAFQPSDAGMVTFAGGVTLVTPGDQSLSVTDTASGITGSATVTVNAPSPSAPPSPTARSRPPLDYAAYADGNALVTLQTAVVTGVGGPVATVPGTIRAGGRDDIPIGGTAAYGQAAGMASVSAIMDGRAEIMDDYFARIDNGVAGNGVPPLDAAWILDHGYGLDPSPQNTAATPNHDSVF
jgi:hypothetical protein